MKIRGRNSFVAKLIQIVLVFVATYSGSALADNYYVKMSSNGGDNSNTGQSWVAAKATIGAAMLLVNGDDTVHVAAGTYNEKIIFHASNNNHLLGGYPADGGGTQAPQDNLTIIDGTGGSSSPMVSVPGNIAASTGYSGVEIDGFTIRNGTHTGYGCAGIESYSLGLRITRNIIENNNATGSSALAGGIYIMGLLNDSGTPMIEDNIIRNNTATAVGGIYLDGASGKADNYVAYLVNNLIHGNNSTADTGMLRGVGGVDVVYPASASIVNCTIADNTAVHPVIAVAGIHIDGFSNEPGIVAMANSIIWNESGDDILVTSNGTLWMAHSNVEDSGDAGGTVISSAPGFMGGGNYHLTAGSPCIETGRDEGTVLKETLSNVSQYSPKGWGDGVHDLHGRWQRLATGQGVMFGSAHITYPSDANVKAVAPPVDISTYDASGLSYPDLHTVFYDNFHVFFQGLNGYYGAWRVDSVTAFGLLNGQSYFQCNGSANFDSGIRNSDLEENPRSFNGGVCQMGAYENISTQTRAIITPIILNLLLN